MRLSRAICISYQDSLINIFCFSRNPEKICTRTSNKKPNPATDGGADAQYEIISIGTAIPHVTPSIPPPPQPTDGDVVYEHIH